MGATTGPKNGVHVVRPAVQRALAALVFLTACAAGPRLANPAPRSFEQDAARCAVHAHALVPRSVLAEQTGIAAWAYQHELERCMSALGWVRA